VKGAAFLQSLPGMKRGKASMKRRALARLLKILCEIDDSVNKMSRMSIQGFYETEGESAE